MEGKRARRHQRRKWEDIKQWTNQFLYECTRLARNRVYWRSITVNLRYGDGTNEWQPHRLLRLAVVRRINSCRRNS